MISTNEAGLANAKVDGKLKEHAEFMTSICQGKLFLLYEDFDKYEMQPKCEEWNERNWLLHDFTMAIKNSFHNGHARQFLYSLFSYLTFDERYFFEAQRKSEVDGFYLEIIQTKIFGRKRPATSSLTTRSAKRGTSGSTTSDTNGSDMAAKSSSDSFSKKHHAKGVRRPDFVVFKRLNNTFHIHRGICTAIFEVKSNWSLSGISEGISQLLSYGLSMRSKQKNYTNNETEKEMALILITPMYWIVSSLPPSTEEIQHPLTFRLINVFAKINGQPCFQINGYLEFLNFLNEFIF